MNIQKEPRNTFTRANVFQLGMIPLFLHLSSYIVNDSLELVRLDIPVYLPFRTGNSIFTLAIIAAGSLRYAVYLLLFLVSAVFVFRFLDYIEGVIQGGFFENEEEKISTDFIFKIILLISMIIGFLYALDNIETHAAPAEILQIYNSLKPASVIISSEWNIIVLLALPVILMLFPVRRIEHAVKVPFRYIHKKLGGYSDENFVGNVPTKKVAYGIEWLYLLTFQLGFVGVFCKYWGKSWKWTALFITLLTAFLLIYILFIFLVRREDQIFLFCESVPMEWRKRSEWLEEYHEQKAAFEETEKTLPQLKNEAEKLALYDDAMLLLLKLGYSDRERACLLAGYLKSDLIVKKEILINDKISQICASGEGRMISEIRNSSAAVKADESIIDLMIESMLLFAEEINAAGSPIVFTGPAEDTHPLQFCCQAAVRSTAVSTLGHTLDFLHFTGPDAYRDVCEKTYALVLARIYASLNGIDLKYEFIDDQLFRFVFIAA